MKRQFFSFLQFLCIFYVHTEPILKISQGILNGTIEVSRNGRKFAHFRGIPYAQPPIGNLRFRNPVPAGNWNGTRQADSFGNRCPQIDGDNIIGNEDCLFLNIYTPIVEFNSTLTSQKTENNLLPVMAFIHGGTFKEGSGDRCKGNYLLDKDVIFVTMNYRLGIFGFLSTGDSVAPGNFGMKDQVLALKWIQKNIKSFGGDPKRVTLVGVSSGGVAANLHAISNASTGLFHQYIIESGSALCPWAYQPKNHFIVYVRVISALVFCPFITSNSLVKCLRETSMETLMNTASFLDTFVRFGQVSWTPTDEPESEHAFLTDSPKNLIEKNQTKDLPFISGVTTDDGLIITTVFETSPLSYYLARLNPYLIIAFLTSYYLNAIHEIKFMLDVDNFYFNGSILIASYDEFFKGFTDFFSDGFFMYPELKMLEKVTPNMKNPNYFYSFGYRGTFSGTSPLDNNKNFGVFHVEEIIYLYPFPPEHFELPNLNYSEADEFVIDLMVDMWTSFATNGKPRSEKLKNPDLWMPYDAKNTIHLQIGNINNNSDPTVTLSNNFHSNRMDFWRNTTCL